MPWRKAPHDPQRHAGAKSLAAAPALCNINAPHHLRRRCYAVYNTALFWNPGVRKEYACLHGGSLPAVHANDVFFALHASVVTALTLIQCALYHRGGQRISWPAALGTGVAGAAITAYLAAVIGAATQGGGGGIAGGAFAVADAPAVPCGSTLSWLSFLYFLSYIKLAVSLVKYIPQVGGLRVWWGWGVRGRRQ